MKKVVAMFLALVMMSVGFLTVTAADLGGFVSSPSANPAPEVVSVTPPSEDCESDVIVTAYSERNTLPEDLNNMMTDAYNSIRGTDNVTTLNASLAALANSKNVPAADLAISNLFDVRYEGCEDHGEHDGFFDIVLSSETFNHFFALLHYTGENWELIDGAEMKMVNDEAHLYFSVKDFSPFAVVVNTGAPVTPPTGDNSHIAIYAAIMAVSAVALVVVFVASKKSKKSV